MAYDPSNAAKLLGQGQWLFSVPLQMLGDAALAVYSQGVSIADNVARGLRKAVRAYEETLAAQAVSSFWHSCAVNHPLLISTAANLQPLDKWQRKVVGLALKDHEALCRPRNSGPMEALLPRPVNDQERGYMNTLALVGYLTTLAQADKGAKAAMRAALFPQLEYRVYPYLVKFVDLRNPIEVAVANVIAFGTATGLHLKDGGSLGAALRKMGSKRESGTAERILNMLFSVHSRETRAELTARSVASFADLGVRLDLDELGHDLLTFNRRTQRKWAADFYAASEASDEEAAPAPGDMS